MRSDEILQILVDWNLWGRQQDTGILRDRYVKLILPFLKTNHAVAVTGVRRSGKSTIMMQVAKKLVDSGFRPEDTLTVNFEDYRFYDLSLKLLQNIYEVYLEKAAKGKARAIFLDEIHKILGWEKFVRTLLDMKEAKMVVSGSNTNLLTKEYASLLTGRHVRITIYPLNFNEFLMFNGITVESEIEALSKRVEVKRLLDEYLEYGGFPEVALSDKKARKKMLLDYVEDIITKDVAERHKVKEKEKLRSLARYYLTNTSTKISFNKLKNLLSIPLRTVERFSYYLEESYLVLFLKRFSFKVREQDKSARKVYSIDVGLSNALGFKFSQDLGRIMENTVFLELIKKNSGNPDFEIYYWQNPQQQEVDFIVKYGRHVKQIIQVCRNIHDPDAKKRELRALLKASVELKCSNLLVITEDREGEEKTQQKKIKYIPLWKWLLQSQQTM